MGDAGDDFIDTSGPTPDIDYLKATRQMLTRITTVIWSLAALATRSAAVQH